MRAEELKDDCPQSTKYQYEELKLAVIYSSCCVSLNLILILKEMLDGMRISRAIHVAAEFGIADLLKEGPKYTAELATETKTNEAFLYRLLRALASVNIFQEVEPHCFVQTPLSTLLT